MTKDELCEECFEEMERYTRRKRAATGLYVAVTVGAVGLTYFAGREVSRTHEAQETINSQLQLLSATVLPRIAVDAELKIRTATESACKLLGYPVGYIVGTKLTDHLIEPVEDAAEERFAKYQRTGQLPNPSEWLMRDSRGDPVPVRMIAEEELFSQGVKWFGIKLKPLPLDPEQEVE